MQRRLDQRKRMVRRSHDGSGRRREAGAGFSEKRCHLPRLVRRERFRPRHQQHGARRLRQARGEDLCGRVQAAGRTRGPEYRVIAPAPPPVRSLGQPTQHPAPRFLSGRCNPNDTPRVRPLTATPAPRTHADNSRQVAATRPEAAAPAHKRTRPHRRRPVQQFAGDGRCRHSPGQPERLPVHI